MKRLSRILLLVLLAFVMLVPTACMIKPETDENGFIFKYNAGSYTLVDYNGEDKVVTVPSSFKGKPVTKIAKSAFAEPTEAELRARFDFNAWNESRTNPNATGWYDKAFYNKVEKVVIPSGVVEIEDYAFNNCSSLLEVVLPESVTTIGAGVFAQCVSLTKVNVEGKVDNVNELPSAIKNIPDGVFYRCLNLSNISLPANVETIGKFTFAHCAKLNDITIGSDVFVGESSLVDGANYDAELVSIGNYAFQNAFTKRGSTLVSINMPNSVNYLGDYVFENASGLQGAYLSEGITTLGASAFKNCVKLNEQTVDMANITTLGESVFEGCTSLTELKLNDKITTISKNAFKGCKGLRIVDLTQYPVTVIGDGAFFDCTGIEELQFNEDTTEIGRNAFANCIEIRSVYVGDTIRTISAGAFKNCSNLVLYYNTLLPTGANRAANWVGEGVTEVSGVRAENLYKDVDGNGNVIAEYVKVTSDEGSFYKLTRYTDRLNRYENVDTLSFTIASAINGTDVKEINESAFKNCTGLVSVSFGTNSKIATIKERAFAYAIDLTAVTEWPARITALPKEIFRGCASLEALALPSNITFVGDYAFADCEKLGTGSGSLEFTNVSSFGEGVFSGCKNLTSVSLLGVGVGQDYKLSAKLFENCENLENITFKSGARIIGIGNSTFKNCTKLNNNNFTLWSTVTEIGESAFEGCTSFTYFEISKNVEKIGNKAFKGCTSVQYFSVNEQNVNFKTDESGILYAATEANIVFKVKIAGRSKLADYNYSFLKINTLMCYPLARTDTEYTVVVSGEASLTYGAAWTKIKNDKYSRYDIEYIYVDGDENNVVSDPNSTLTVAGLSHKITEIKAYAFEGAQSLETVYIGEGVVIGAGAFDNCVNLKKIAIQTDDTVAIKQNIDDNGVLIGLKDGVATTLVKYPSNKVVDEYTVVDTVTTLAENSFVGAQIDTLKLGKGIAVGGIKLGAFKDAKFGEIVIDTDLVYGVDAEGNLLPLQVVDAGATVEVEGFIEKLRITNAVDGYRVDEYGLLYSINVDTEMFTYSYGALVYVPTSVDFNTVPYYVPDGVKINAYAFSGNPNVSTIVVNMGKAIGFNANSLYGVNPENLRIVYTGDRDEIVSTDGSLYSYFSEGSGDGRAFEDRIYYYSYTTENIPDADYKYWYYASALDGDGNVLKFNGKYNTDTNVSIVATTGSINVKDGEKVIMQEISFKVVLDLQAKYDEEGNPILTEVLDENGLPIVKLDENGDPIQKTDENGDLVFDADNNPVYEYEMEQDYEYAKKDNGEYAPLLNNKGEEMYEFVFSDYVVGDANDDPFYNTRK